MQRPTLRYLCAAVSIATLLAAMPARAGLQDALDGMFMSNGTSPQAFNSQTRGGFVGGGVAVRAPIRNINLVSFDPPRLNAGCGGIDIFGGSFSFINADQLVALFRQIAANAVGLAFKAAIDAINPKLGELMTEFQSKVQALNENMRNTCAVANMLMKPITDAAARKENTDKEAVAGQASKGAFDDLLAGFSSLLSRPNKAAADTLAQDSNPNAGNLVWRALLNSNAAQILGNPDSGEPDPNMTNQIAMSLVGAVITTTGQSTGTQPNGTEKEDTGEVRPATLTLYDLHDGSSQKPLKIWKCTNGFDANKCTTLAEGDLSFIGMKGYVNKMLFGQAVGAAGGVDPSSIIGKLQNCTSGGSSGSPCAFTTAQKNFLNAVQTPALAMIRRVQASPGAVEHVALRLVDVLATELTVRYGEAVVRALRMAFNNGKVTKHEPIQAAETQRMLELSEFRTQAARLMEQNQSVVAYIDEVVKSNPSIFPKLK
ncbi:conjugal transfer protein TraH [Rubrivivax gelatinosus]|uniref:conjugal transfer protein TraH n=1 Tax=Rubrivivax gelatinosus TaxID=28068 RepID=UPI0005C18590|nr:conjugal transfer protein TraH [Rubrivivax gelatinosus]MBG6083000.1 conjugative transfer pilus assembly protein TraH [Rubrivivax gelatinosus]